jgi:acetyl esterase/lipase
MRWIRVLFCLLLFPLLSACAQAGLIAANVPARFNDRPTHMGIAYGTADHQKLDLYLPASPEKLQKPADVVVFFHGGRWTYGKKEQFYFVANTLAARGFVVVVPDYAKYPTVKFPAFVEDGAKALAWAHRHIAEYGGDPSRIHVAGHSAGAHMGALLTADSSYLKKEGLKPKGTIRSFTGLAGPYAFTPDEPDLIDMFGPPSRYPSMQVTTFITGHEPPMLLLYGDADKDVKPYNLEKLQARIREKGGKVKSIVYPGVDHIRIIGAFSWMGDAKIVDDTASFMRAQ